MKYSTAKLTVNIITDNNGWTSCMHACFIWMPQRARCDWIFYRLFYPSIMPIEAFIGSNVDVVILFNGKLFSPFPTFRLCIGWCCCCSCFCYFSWPANVRLSGMACNSKLHTNFEYAWAVRSYVEFGPVNMRFVSCDLTSG